MNFGDWQAQQKAQKDEERLRKKQAAEALTQYRSEGLSEEDTKLKELREQERQQRTEAKQKLQEFKSTLSEEDAKKAALKEAEIKKKKEEEEQLRKLATPKNDGNNENLFVEGAVKSLADNFVNEDGDDKVPSPSPTSVVINEQVTFVFGLISEGDVNDEEDDVSSLSSLDGYLVAINNLLQENTQSPKAQSVKLGYPKVVKIEIDDGFKDPAGRDNVKRRMITVSIPISSSSSDIAAEACTSVKSQIVDSLRFAIQNDSLKRLPQQ